MKEVILRGITLDNGGSEVRVLPLGNHVPGGLLTIPSEFYEISEKNFRIKDVEDPKSLCVFKKAPNPEYLGIMASGLTGRAFIGTSIMLNSQEKKTSSLNYYKQFLFSVARDAINAYTEDQYYNTSNAQVETKGLFARRVNVSKQEYRYVIVTCIPIIEFSGNEDCAKKLKASIEGVYEVEYPLVEGSPRLTFVIDSRYVGVTPEGGVAVTGLKRELGQEDISLVVDMGHITTDISLFQGTHLLGKVRSSLYAGNMLVGEVRNALEAEGFRLSDDQTKRVIETGIAKRGTQEINVSRLVDEQKVAFVKNYLKPEVIQVLNRNALNAGQVQYFVPIGAPMQDIGRNSVRQAIIDNCGLEHATVKNAAGSTKYANIIAASIFTEKIYRMAEKALKAEAEGIV